MNWKWYFEASFAQRGQAAGELPLPQLWQSIQLPARQLWGAGWFPCLYVDDLVESFMTSGWMTKEGGGRSMLWSVHVLVQACCSRRKENRCRRKSGSGVWGEKKGCRSLISNQHHTYSVAILWERWPWPLLSASPHCWVVTFSDSPCLPTAHPASTKIPSLCWVLPNFLRQPHTVQRHAPSPGQNPWSQTARPCPSASVTETSIWGRFL